VSHSFWLREKRKQRPLAVIEVGGGLTSAAAVELHLRCTALCDAGFTHLVLDLSAATLIVSGGVGALVALTYDALEHGGGLQLACVAQPVMRVIDALDSRDFLNVTAGVDEAIASANDVAVAE
jgi:anti-anti-sigma factor